MPILSKRSIKQTDAPVYRVNISYLRSDTFGTYSILGKNSLRQIGLSSKLDELKRHVLELLISHQKPKGLSHYMVAWQTHQSNGLAHLDILLNYQTNVKKRSSSFDYLLPICPQDLHQFSQAQGRVPQVYITPYSRSKLSAAVLDYGRKEDPTPIVNWPEELSQRILTLSWIKKDPYGYFSEIMKQDPINFDLAAYTLEHNLDKQVKGWSALKTKITDIRASAIALRQYQKPGIKFISRQLIQDRLTPQELQVFDSHQCFQNIVDHLNQIPLFGSTRPHKTSNLFLSGPKDIGKTALAQKLSKLVGCYNLKYQNKYLNKYVNNRYGFIIWNQTKFTDFTHTWILQFLEGVQVPIPMRYNACSKRDNPLIIMTSNLPLASHIRLRFGKDPSLQQHATQNLNARITPVHVPVSMIFMQKLLIPANLE